MNIGFLNLQPLQDASLAIQLHVVFAIVSFVVGAMILWRRKGGPSHKKWGKFWVFTMAGTALTSFFIFEIRMVGPFSPIHLVSIFVLISLYLAIKHVRVGNVSAHKKTMINTYVGGMLIAGGLTFLPGRIMHQIVIDPVEVYWGALNRGEATGISTATWLVPVVVTMLIVVLLNGKALLARIRSD